MVSPKNIRLILFSPPVITVKKSPELEAVCQKFRSSLGYDKDSDFLEEKKKRTCHSICFNGVEVSGKNTFSTTQN